MVGELARQDQGRFALLQTEILRLAVKNLAITITHRYRRMRKPPHYRPRPRVLQHGFFNVNLVDHHADIKAPLNPYVQDAVPCKFVMPERIEHRTALSKPDWRLLQTCLQVAQYISGCLVVAQARGRAGVVGMQRLPFSEQGA